MQTPPADVPNNAFALPLKVNSDDIDAQQHVSNVNQVKWISRAAYQHSVALGYDIERFKSIGAWFVVRRHEIDYMSPALLNDELILYTWPSDIGKIKAERQHRIYRVSDGTLITQAVNIWAYLSIKDARPIRIPQTVRDTFDPARFQHDTNQQ